MTENYYDVLLGFSDELDDKSTELYSVKEVADFIHTHGGGYITETDGTPLLQIAYGNYFEISEESDFYSNIEDNTLRNEGEGMCFVFCNDMRYKYALMSELRKGEGFEDRYQW